MSHRLLQMRHLPTVWVPLSNPCELPDTAPHSVHHTSIHVVSAEGDHDSPSLETSLMQWIIGMVDVFRCALPLYRRSLGSWTGGEQK
jgi:DNA repair exonuclease SbcCD nuclease subunit